MTEDSGRLCCGPCWSRRCWAAGLCHRPPLCQQSLPCRRASPPGPLTDSTRVDGLCQRRVQAREEPCQARAPPHHRGTVAASSRCDVHATRRSACICSLSPLSDLLRRLSAPPCSRRGVTCAHCLLASPRVYRKPLLPATGLSRYVCTDSRVCDIHSGPHRDHAIRRGQTRVGPGPSPRPTPCADAKRLLVPPLPSCPSSPFRAHAAHQTPPVQPCSLLPRPLARLRFHLHRGTKGAKSGLVRRIPKKAR